VSCTAAAPGVRLETDTDVARQTDVSDDELRYVPDVKRIDNLAIRLRAIDPVAVDIGLAVAFVLVGIATAFGQDIHDDAGALSGGYREPDGLLVVTAVMIGAPIAFRRRAPLVALMISALGLLTHLIVGWPEGSLPLATLLLTYSVAAWCSLRAAIAGLAVVAASVVVLTITGSPSLDAVGVIGVVAQFAAAWAIGLAMHNRRAVEDALVRQADGRAESERQRTARVLAEERLRIAQELHDIVGHSMSVIAVQAGVGAHVLDQHPERARAALDTISATSRGTLAEMRRLLGMLRDSDGAPTNAPAPCLADLPRLVADVRAAGVPVTLDLDTGVGASAGLELSAYRVVQEALTNVIKHAGRPTRVDVTIRHLPDALVVQVVDDGCGPTATAAPIGADGAGHGLVGMRERVEVWGGELTVGPAPGGGYRVDARLPYGDQR
jgi:signal transduction histidine kinase